MPKSEFITEYVGALLSEASTRSHELKEISTIYIGGGTPSLLSAEQWDRMMCGIFSLLPDSQIKEFTIEVNPDDVTVELVDRWMQSGVNRVSMGVQSFNDDSLRFLGRRHSSVKALNAFEIISKVGNVSLDLIYGYYGQTPLAWREDLCRMLDLHPQHLSAYSLSVEENTILARRAEKGSAVEATEEFHRKMYEMLCEELVAAGYEHYELSSFALPGFRSEHNSLYWRGAPYVGLGPSASGYDGLRTRRTNDASLRKYIEAFSDKHSQEAPNTTEVLTDEELFEELVMTRLRTCEGLRCADVESSFGSERLKSLLRNAARQLRSGLLKEKDGALILTRQGMFVSDAVIVDLIS